MAYEALENRRELPYHAAGDGEWLTREAFGRLDWAAIPGARMIRSSGATGEPGFWVRSSRDLEQDHARWGQGLLAAGVQAGDRVAVLLPNRDVSEAVLGGVERMGAVGLAAMVGEEDVIVPAFSPTVLMTTPLHAYHLMAAGSFPAVTRLLLTGDVGRGIFRRRSDLVPNDLVVRDIYAVTEHPGPLAVECSEGMLHWGGLEDSVRVEFLPFSRKVLLGAQPVAEVGIASNDAEAVPLLRFRTGDVVRLEEEEKECACGQNSPRTSLILGRLDESPLLNRLPVFASRAANAFLGIEAVGTGFQFAIRHDRGRDRDTFAVELECGPDGNPEAIKTAAETFIRESFHAIPWVNVHPPGTLDPARRIRVWDWRGVRSRVLA